MGLECGLSTCTRDALCDACLWRNTTHLGGTAARRGELWAQRVIRSGRRPRDRPWWPWETSRHVAIEQVDDLGSPDPRAREALARAAWEQAARTWARG